MINLFTSLTTLYLLSIIIAMVGLVTTLLNKPYQNTLFLMSWLLGLVAISIDNLNLFSNYKVSLVDTVLLFNQWVVLIIVFVQRNPKRPNFFILPMLILLQLGDKESVKHTYLMVEVMSVLSLCTLWYYRSINYSASLSFALLQLLLMGSFATGYTLQHHATDHSAVLTTLSQGLILFAFCGQLGLMLLMQPIAQFYQRLNPTLTLFYYTIFMPYSFYYGLLPSFFNSNDSLGSAFLYLLIASSGLGLLIHSNRKELLIYTQLMSYAFMLFSLNEIKATLSAYQLIGESFNILNPGDPEIASYYLQTLYSIIPLILTVWLYVLSGLVGKRGVYQYWFSSYAFKSMLIGVFGMLSLLSFVESNISLVYKQGTLWYLLLILIYYTNLTYPQIKQAQTQPVTLKEALILLCQGVIILLITLLLFLYLQQAEFFLKHDWTLGYLVSYLMLLVAYIAQQYYRIIPHRPLLSLKRWLIQKLQPNDKEHSHHNPLQYYLQLFNNYLFTQLNNNPDYRLIPFSISVMILQIIALLSFLLIIGLML